MEIFSALVVNMIILVIGLFVISLIGHSRRVPLAVLIVSMISLFGHTSSSE